MTSIALGNSSPTFASYSVSTAYETAAGISSGMLLAKAADADGDALSVTFTDESPPEGSAFERFICSVQMRLTLPICQTGRP